MTARVANRNLNTGHMFASAMAVVRQLISRQWWPENRAVHMAAWGAHAAGEADRGVRIWLFGA